jgi:molybdenum cofactor guanylyltransferase
LNVVADVERLLQEGRLRPVFLFETVPTRVVEAAELAAVDSSFQSLRNSNTPQDYEAALQDAQRPA